MLETHYSYQGSNYANFFRSEIELLLSDFLVLSFVNDHYPDDCPCLGFHD